MKAVQLVEPARVEVVDVPRPAIGESDVLLEITASGVCQTDVHIRAMTEEWVPRGTILGHEFAGVVAQVGNGVHGWSEGDGAVVYPVWSCGHCVACRGDRQNACRGTGVRAMPAPTPGVSTNGGMAEFAAVPASALVPIGELDPLVAAPLSDAGLTPYHSVRTVRHLLVPGSSCVVIGAGGLGKMAAQILRALTPAEVIVLDISDAALRSLEGSAHHTLRADDADAAERVLELTGGAGAEAVLDIVGADETLALSAQIVAPGGAIRAIGLAGGTLPVATSPADLALPWGVSVTRPYSGTYNDLAEVIALARSGTVAPKPVRFDLEQALTAFDRLAEGEIDGRAVLVP
jgi:propanol-preferring alcohol dehydrogenase